MAPPHNGSQFILWRGAMPCERILRAVSYRQSGLTTVDNPLPYLEVATLTNSVNGASGSSGSGRAIAPDRGDGFGLIGASTDA